jgi:hypothetical protein
MTTLYVHLKEFDERSLKVLIATMKLEEIVEEASKLSEKERAFLASKLLHGLQIPIYEVSDEEVTNRIKEVEENPNLLLTFDELVAGLKHRGN